MKCRQHLSISLLVCRQFQAQRHSSYVAVGIEPTVLNISACQCEGSTPWPTFTANQIKLLVHAIEILRFACICDEKVYFASNSNSNSKLNISHKIMPYVNGTKSSQIYWKNNTRYYGCGSNALFSPTPN